MTTNENVTPTEQLTGRVKWFNNKAGFGFITVTDGDRSGSDIFVHHSAINVENQQYKYLVQGEYVEFGLSKSSVDNHEWQATGVHGIKGGKLMCETRREYKLARTTYKSSNPEQTQNQEPRQTQEPRQKPSRQPARQRGEGPREEKGDWSLVNNEGTAKRRGRPPRQPQLQRQSQSQSK